MAICIKLENCLMVGRDIFNKIGRPLEVAWRDNYCNLIGWLANNKFRSPLVAERRPSLNMNDRFDDQKTCRPQVSDVNLPSLSKNNNCQILLDKFPTLSKWKKKNWMMRHSRPLVAWSQRCCGMLTDQNL